MIDTINMFQYLPFDKMAAIVGRFDAIPCQTHINQPIDESMAGKDITIDLKTPSAHKESSQKRDFKRYFQTLPFIGCNCTATTFQMMRDKLIAHQTRLITQLMPRGRQTQRIRAVPQFTPVFQHGQENLSRIETEDRKHNDTLAEIQRGIKKR